MPSMMSGIPVRSAIPRPNKASPCRKLGPSGLSSENSAKRAYMLRPTAASTAMITVATAPIAAAASAATKSPATATMSASSAMSASTPTAIMAMPVIAPNTKPPRRSPSLSMNHWRTSATQPVRPSHKAPSPPQPPRWAVGDSASCASWRRSASALSVS